MFPKNEFSMTQVLKLPETWSFFWLCRDVGAVVQALYGEDNPPPIILVGHR